MSHEAQIQFCQQVANKYPKHFIGVSVLDVGSADINGNNRYLFDNSNYTGIDIGAGRNVNVVCPVHVFPNRTKTKYDTIICTEMLEHDKHWEKSLQAMYNLLHHGGLLLLTAAGKNRAEHGTTRTSPEASPYTNDYYKNITPTMINSILNQNKNPFKHLEITEFNNSKDIGIVLIK
jgi:SAM-dependent methyltransferase